MIETRPRTTYDCTTMPEPFIWNGERHPAGAILCSAWTNDNRDSGYIGEEASWWTVCRDRAMFDRIVGKSRRGILHDVTVHLDGEVLR